MTLAFLFTIPSISDFPRLLLSLSLRLLNCALLTSMRFFSRIKSFIMEEKQSPGLIMTGDPSSTHVADGEITEPLL